MLDANREQFNSFLKLLGKHASRVPLSPNQWTLLSLIPALCSSWLVFLGSYLLAAVFLFLAVLIDIIDGSVARYIKKVSKFGGYLDSITDRIVEFLIIFALFSVPYPSVLFSPDYWIGLLLFGSMLIPLTRAVASEKKVFRGELKGGILERAERVSLLILILVTAELSLFISMLLIIITSVLALITALQKILMVYKHVNTRGSWTLG